MIARTRGDHSGSGRRVWEPLSQTAAPLVPPSVSAPMRQARNRLPWMISAMLAVIVAVTLPISLAKPNSSPVAGTPSAWVQAWTADTLDDPVEVCQVLFAPSLAERFSLGSQHGCLRSYRAVHTVSFRIIQVIQDHMTAFVQGRDVARQAGRVRTFTVELSRSQGAWRAVRFFTGLHNRA